MVNRISRLSWDPTDRRYRRAAYLTSLTYGILVPAAIITATRDVTWWSMMWSMALILATFGITLRVRRLHRLADRIEAETLEPLGGPQ